MNVSMQSEHEHAERVHAVRATQRTHGVVQSEHGRVWVPLDAYEQLLEITQEELSSQMHKVLTERSRERERKAARTAALLGPPQGDFVPPVREKLATPYPMRHHPKPSYRRIPPPDRPVYDMGMPHRRPPPLRPPPPPPPSGPNPTSLNEKLDQLFEMPMAGASRAATSRRSSREPGEDLAALAGVGPCGRKLAVLSAADWPPKA